MANENEHTNNAPVRSTPEPDITPFSRPEPDRTTPEIKSRGEPERTTQPPTPSTPPAEHN
jgi:hypothetical protein